MPKIFTGTPQQPTTKVLRIQHKVTGRGPYVDNDNEEVSKIMEGSRLPSPQNGLMGWTDNDIHHLNDPSLIKRFGFENHAQMRRSISQKQLDALKAHGYEPTWVEASHVWGGDGKQVFFATPEDEKKQKESYAKLKLKEFKNIGGKMVEVQPNTSTPIADPTVKLKKKLVTLKKALSKFNK